MAAFTVHAVAAGASWTLFKRLAVVLSSSCRRFLLWHAFEVARCKTCCACKHFYNKTYMQLRGLRIDSCYCRALRGVQFVCVSSVAAYSSGTGCHVLARVYCSLCSQVLLAMVGVHWHLSTDPYM